MGKRMIKYLVACLFVFLVVSPLAAASAKVTYVKGKVEVQRKGAWVQLKTGDYVAEKETVSTGYQSEARFDLNGSILVVSAMSRITLETLKTSSDKTEVSVYVNSGATRSKVKHADNKKVDYQTRTAVAVASVRGTDYTQNARGDSSCGEGYVFVCTSDDFKLNMNENPGSTVIYPGQCSGIDNTGKTIAGTFIVVMEQTRIESKGFTAAEQSAGDTMLSEEEATAQIFVTVSMQ